MTGVQGEPQPEFGRHELNSCQCAIKKFWHLNPWTIRIPSPHSCGSESKNSEGLARQIPTNRTGLIDPSV